MPRPFLLTPPTIPESSEAQAFMRWVRWAEPQYPELAVLYHIPNGGARDVQTGARLKKEGVLAGMPDYCLPVPRGGYGALYLELKQRAGGQLSKSQILVQTMLGQFGNCVVVCHGWEAARKAILDYLLTNEGLYVAK